MHHASLLVGTLDWARIQIPQEEQILGQDVLLYNYERMSIANVRSLIYEAGLRPVARAHRTFIIVCDSILHEAQNALLKIFEEPNNHTIFYLVIPREDMLLPTLRSRMQLIGVEEMVTQNNYFSEFLEIGYAERLACIAQKLKEEDTLWVEMIVRGVEQYAREKRDAVLIKDALMLSAYMHTTGSSKKMLLEHIALSVSRKNIILTKTT